jgi:hypothetical protein
LTPKLLGIPSIPDSTGESQNKAVVTLMEDWEVIDSVVAMCFNTTASNTGRWKGSVALIERRLNHPVMWLACRHHVYELHIKHVAEFIMGKRNSPSEGLFRRFKKEWDQDYRDGEDYRELLELTVIYFGGSTSRKFKLRKPGAHHHARFMAYAIYFLKIELMSERFSHDHNERNQ